MKHFILGLLFFSCAQSPLRLENHIKLRSGLMQGFKSREVSQTFLVHDETQLYVVKDNHRLIAVDGRRGKRKWSFNFKEPVQSGVGIDETSVYAGSLEGNVWAIDKSNGKKRWMIKVSQGITGQGVIHEDQILVQTILGQVYALNKNTGALIWRYKREPNGKISVLNVLPALWINGKWVVSTQEGSVVGLDAQTGQEVWVQSLPSQDKWSDVVGLNLVGPELQAHVFESPVTVIDPTTGTSFTLERLGSFAKNIVMPKGHLDPGVKHTLTLMNEKDEEVWQYNGGAGAGWSGIAVDDKFIYGASFEGFMDVISLETGKRVWRYHVETPIQGAPVKIGEKIWVLTQKGDLLSFKSRS